MKSSAPALALMLAVVTLLVGCQTAAPIRYYTLLPTAVRDARPAQDPAFRIALGAVTIPAQVDTPRIVLRQSAGQLLPVEDQRWVAPLADEARAAIAAALGQQFGVPEVGDAGNTNDGLPLIRVRVSLRRFESALGQQALIDATWSIARSGNPAAGATCDSRVEVKASGGFDALAVAHQQALIALSTRIARGIEALNAGKTSGVCSAADGG